MSPSVPITQPTSPLADACRRYLRRPSGQVVPAVAEIIRTEIEVAETKFAYLDEAHRRLTSVMVASLLNIDRDDNTIDSLAGTILAAVNPDIAQKGEDLLYGNTLGHDVSDPILNYIDEKIAAAFAVGVAVGASLKGGAR